MAQRQSVNYEHLLRQGGDRMLREASAYFAGGGQLRGTLRRLTGRLDAEGIPYALLGGLALAEHGYPRLTEDIDLLLTPSGLERFRQQLVGQGNIGRPSAEPGKRSVTPTQGCVSKS